MPTTPLALLGLSFVLGLRHALDVDHLAAVSTIVSQRRSLRSASLVGALWGLGHTAALIVMALVVIALRTEIPPRVASALELGVAAMLVGLGVSFLWTLVSGGQLHHHAHAHGGHVHVHPHVHAPARAGGTNGPHVRRQLEAADGHHHAWAWRRPVAVGLVHGLAGSAGLMVAVLAVIPSPALALGYVAVFGAGSIAGMVAMSALLGVPLALAAEHFGRAEAVLRACAALGSVTVGLALAWQIGVETGVLL
jgi:high-affinity nickel permease